MPHNYFFTSFDPKRKVDIQKTVPPAGIEREGRLRRANPLFIHVHPIGQEFCGSQLVLPAPIVPAGDRVKMVRPRDRNGLPEFSCEAPYTPDWNIYRQYFDFVKEQAKHREP